jgi:hypothetical protein
MSNIVVPRADEVWCFTNEGGDVLLARDPNEWEGSERITILIPRANVPGLIDHLQALMAEGA